MATRAKTTLVSQLPDDDGTGLSLAESLAEMPIKQMTEDEISAEEQLQNVLAELGGESDAKVNVYRIEPGKDNAFVGSFEPSIFSVENLQMTYGEGDYLVHVRAAGRIMTRRKIRIAKPLNSNVAVSMQQNNDLPRLLEVMQNGFSQMSQNMANALSQIAASIPKPKSSMETLEELRIMREVMGFNNPVGNNSADALEQFLKGVTFAKDALPRDGEPGAMDILKTGLETLAPLIQEGVARQHAAQIPPPIPAVPQRVQQIDRPLPSPNLTDEAVHILHQQPVAEADMNIMEKMYLNTLVKNAANNNDPVTYANMALDMLGIQTALQYAQHPDFFKTLCEKVPEASAYPEWFEEFRLTIIEIALDEQAEAMRSGQNNLTSPENADTNASSNAQGQTGDASTGDEPPAA